MNRKGLSIFLILLNALGVACLIYCAVPLILNDTAVPNPDSMLALERWDSGGALLTIGLLPLLAANILGFLFIAKGQIRLKYRLLFFLPGLICTLLVLYYILLSFQVIPGFFPKPSIANVTLKDPDTGKETHYEIFEGERRSLTSPFEEDPIEIYSADYNDFTAYIEDGKVLNRLTGTKLSDGDGNLIEADEELQRLMTCAARELEHDIWEFLIIRDGDDLFAYVKLNVNWSDPCDLYRYDPQNDTLIHLCRWQNKDFSGIRVLEGAE